MMTKNTFNYYGTYDTITNFSYNIIAFLIQNNEDIWKLLKYPEPNALSQPNLTQDEKTAMIYKGEVDSDPFRVFTSGYFDDSKEIQCSQLRIYIDSLIPDNHIWGTVNINMEILSHNKIAVLEDGTNRLEVMLQNVIKTINGINIEGLGAIALDRKFSGYNRAKIVSFNKFYRGFMLSLSTHAGG